MASRKAVAIGNKIAWLTLLEDLGTGQWYERRVLCHCDCGNEGVFILSEIKAGRRTSCGCAKKRTQRGVSKGFKYCPPCGKAKPLVDFPRSGSSYFTYCNICNRKNVTKWAQDNPLKAAASAKQGIAVRRARSNKALGSFTSADVLELLELQKEKCYYCNKSVRNSYHIDHKTPLSRGGTNFPSNLAITCAFDNLSKGIKTEAEYKQTLRERQFHGT